MAKFSMISVSVLLAILNLVGVITFKSVSAEIYFDNKVPHVKLAHGGILSGEVKLSRNGNQFNSFVGIQYAVVPERFQASHLVEDRWEGVKEAVNPGHICPQAERQLDLTKGLTGSEDCLNLNVYVPHVKNTNNLPVLLWIHGGSFAFGNGISYSPVFFMDQTNVILITVNYRLGAFGFLSTEDEVVPGNNGLKDLVKGLQWIQTHISAFGGDPEKVTIFGESAGGAAVHYLMLSPMAKGLFHKAVSQSGSALGLWAFQPNAKENAQELAKYAGCSSLASSKEIVSCLSRLTTDELVMAQSKFKKDWPENHRPLFFVPTSEPKDSPNAFLTIHPVESILNQDAYLADVPWMIGATEDEGCVFWSGIVLDKPNLISELDSNWKSIAPVTFDYGNYVPLKSQNDISDRLRRFYFGKNAISVETGTNLTNLYSDNLVLHSVLRAALSTATKKDRKNPVYLYQYAYPGPISLLGTVFNVASDQAKKVGHGDELQHQFDLLGLKSQPKDEEFSNRFIRLFTKFAATGYPTHPFSPTWGEPWEPLSITSGQSPQQSLKWYRISDKEPEMVNINAAYLDRLKFWDTTWQYHFIPSVQIKNAAAALKATTENTNNQKTEL